MEHARPTTSTRSAPPTSRVHYRVTNDWQMYVWEDIDKFAEDYGVDYTVVNRDIYYWDIHWAWKVLAPLDEDWISDSSPHRRVRQRAGHPGHRDQRPGLRRDRPGRLPTPPARDEYGYVDDLVATPTRPTPKPAHRARSCSTGRRTALRNLSGTYPPPVGIVIPANTTLLPGAPWQVEDLIPGAWFRST